MTAPRLVTGVCDYCTAPFARLIASDNPVRYCTSEHRDEAQAARQRRRRLGRAAADDPKVAALLRDEQFMDLQTEMAREARAAAERAAVEAKAAAERAELERLARCPRRDKAAWQTRKAVADVIKLMRAAKRPRSENLHPYLCPGCSWWHAGDRTAYASWQAKMAGETA